MDLNQTKKTYDAPQIVELGSVNSYVQATTKTTAFDDSPLPRDCTVVACFYVPSG